MKNLKFLFLAGTIIVAAGFSASAQTYGTQSKSMTVNKEVVPESQLEAIRVHTENPSKAKHDRDMREALGTDPDTFTKQYRAKLVKSMGLPAKAPAEKTFTKADVKARIAQIRTENAEKLKAGTVPLKSAPVSTLTKKETRPISWQDEVDPQLYSIPAGYTPPALPAGKKPAVKTSVKKANKIR